MTEREQILTNCRYWCSPVTDCEVFLVRPQGREFDAEGYERGWRINGACECPKCGLWWPNVEEPEAWQEGEGRFGVRWYATEWFGHAECIECGLIMVQGFDQDYVIEG